MHLSPPVVSSAIKEVLGKLLWFTFPAVLLLAFLELKGEDKSLFTGCHINALSYRGATRLTDQEQRVYQGTTTLSTLQCFSVLLYLEVTYVMDEKEIL